MTHTALRHSITHASRLLLAAALSLAACAVFAPTARAGVLVAAAGDCGTQKLEQPFLRWLDPAQYTLLPGGAFEGSSPGWSLSGARVVSGNEPYYVHGASDRKSLSLPAGSKASSGVMCVGIEHPTMRFFARSTGGSAVSSLKVEVLFELATGQVASLPIGTALADAHRSWQPTLPMTVLANLLPLLPDGRTPVAFRFTPVGAASWTIDDVYVDPRRK